nr:reverse transcriptase domain-containing protein [Tanacetum cinerariifolium]
ACPHHGFSELHQLDTFYNALNVNDQDSLNSAARINFLDKMPRECLKIIESKSKVHQSRAKAVIAKVSTSSSTPAISSEVFELKDLVRALLLDKKNQSSAPAQSSTPTPVKSIVPNCVTCGGAQSYQNFPVTSKNVYRDNIQDVPIPYPSRCDNERRRDQANKQIEKFYEIFKEMSFEIRFMDPLILMPKFASTLKALIRNKEKLSEMARTPMNEHCSAVILNKFPRKLGDPSKFLIPCEFLGMDECLSLVDLDASINLMPLFVLEGLSLPELTSTCMTLKLVDRSVSKPIGITKDVSVKVGVFHFPADFVVVDFELDPRVPLILGRFFLKTGRALINVHKGKLTLRIGNEAITYNLDQTDDLDSPKINLFYYDPEGDILLLDAILNSEPLPPPNHKQYMPSYKKELKVFEAKTDKSSVDEPPDVKLKDLPPYLDPWVSSVHCVPKKGGFIVGENEENELIPTRLVTGWWVCIDYRKLNEATRKDHFPLPFIDQMLERLAGNEYYCFLDGFSGYFQISIDPRDQEKTTFTCPYGTFAYRRMPFGLCNAPGMFQRCMLASFHDMVEKTMEVFMDDFSVFGNSFENCLSRFDKMLQRCEDTNLSLKWEKSHFMVKEGIVLGHKISKIGLRLTEPKSMSLLNYLIPQPSKNTPFIFSKDCIKAFQTLKKKLTEAPILIALNWDLPFELMYDASDFAIALKDNPTPSFDCKTKSLSTSLDSLLEETSTFHNSLPEFENFYFDLGEISSGSTTTHSDISLSEYESFIFEEFVDELAHIISPPEYDCFYFKDLPDQVVQYSRKFEDSYQRILSSKSQFLQLQLGI